MGDYEDYEENVPDHFHNTKWPNPRPRYSRPTGKDEALVWFMDFYQEDIAEQVDVRRLNKRNRFNYDKFDV